MDKLYALQTVREINHIIRGRVRSEKADERAIEAGDQTSVEKSILGDLIPPVRNFLAVLIESFDKTQPIWFAAITSLDLDLVAACALRTAFECVGLLRGCDLQKAIKNFGKSVWILYQYESLSKDSKKLVERRNRPRTRLAAIRAESAKESDQAALTDAEYMQLGEPLINAVISTGIFEVAASYHNRKSLRRFVLSADGRALVCEVQDLQGYLKPILSPMIVPPVPWTSMEDGGYLSDLIGEHLSLVRTRDREQQARLAVALRDGRMNAVLSAVNALQAVPLRLNPYLVGLRQWAFDHRLRPGKLPLQDAVDVPAVAADTLPEKTRRRLGRTRKDAMRVNAGIMGNLLATRALSGEAEELLGFERFYQPHSLDSRGRVYPVAPFSHHNADNIKALFEFAEGVRLGSDGLRWLKIHVANCGDFDKISKKTFAERIQWTDDHMAMVRSIAGNAQQDRRWLDADAPFAFVAACRELVAALSAPDPSSHVSHLPIYLDGSCSGVQHYACALRADEGVHVNVFPDLTPHDLYAVVASRVAAECARVWTKARRNLDGKDLVSLVDEITERMRLAAENKELDKRKRLERGRNVVIAALWHNHGIGRSIVKRPTMTFGYSSKAYGMSNQIIEDFMEPLAQEVLEGVRSRHPFGADDGRAAAVYLGKLIYKTVRQVLPTVAAGMEWLQVVAGLLADAGHGVLLTSRLGFPMVCKPLEWDTKRVELLLLNRTVAVREGRQKDKALTDGSVLRRFQTLVQTDTKFKVIKHQAKSGIAPNVVHSLDACHLMMVVNGLVAKEIRDFLVIHDSFGVHAGHVEVLRGVLVDKLASMYEDFDPFAEIETYARTVLSPESARLIPPRPMRGSMVLRSVRRSAYAFC